MLFVRGKQLELDIDPPARGVPEERPGPASGEDLELHARRLGAALGMLLQQSVDVALTNNRSTMISYRFTGGRLKVRMHRMFRHAVGEDIADIAAFIAGERGSSSGAVDAFIESHRDEVRGGASRGRRANLRTAGRAHDLDEVLQRVRNRYFGGLGEVRITWGRSRSTGAKRGARTRSRALATYNFDDGTIRVNPVLDSPRVPRYVLEWVVYHELLHHVLPVEESRGRRRYHTRRFRTLEKAFDRYEQAIAWEEANLDWLLR